LKRKNNNKFVTNCRSAALHLIKRKTKAKREIQKKKKTYKD